MSIKKTKSRDKIIFILVFLLTVFFASTLMIFNKVAGSKNTNLSQLQNKEEKNDTPSDKTVSSSTVASSNSPAKKASPIRTEVTINSVGDCTIGNDDSFAYATSLPAILQSQNSDYSYFFKNVAEIFKNDDLTIANLETTFTNATAKAEKQFTFKADPILAKSLSSSSIEGVNLANNHIYDYLKKGFDDTILSLKKENINYFGEGHKWTTEVKGHKFGFLGYRAFYYDANFLTLLKNDIASLKAQNCTVILNLHWGDENAYSPNATQKYIGHFAIDNGADLVIGHHPHVMEGIEGYKDKFIAYSLGNFCFGGNNNPGDKDTFILQTKFIFEKDALVSIGIKPIPCSISSVEYKNDYCPTPSIGDKKAQILNRLNAFSKPFGTVLKDDFIYSTDLRDLQKNN